ncbi:MAG: hypothetical protein PVJ98_09670 [Akkermansiaceae bacterium]
MNTIPYCTNEFLQDVSIAIGRRRKRFTYAGCKFEVGGTDECECLILYHPDLRIKVWADRTVQVAFHPTSTFGLPKRWYWFYPETSAFTPIGIAEAMRDSVAACTADMMKDSWDYTGELESN